MHLWFEWEWIRCCSNADQQFGLQLLPTRQLHLHPGIGLGSLVGERPGVPHRSASVLNLHLICEHSTLPIKVCAPTRALKSLHTFRRVWTPGLGCD